MSLPLPEARIVRDAATRSLMAEDVAGAGEATPEAVLRPETPEEVAAICAAARAEGRAVIPRGGGMSYTGGYLVGFVVAAGVVGWLAEQGWDKSVIWTAVSMVIGSLIIYAFGVAWLASIIGLQAAFWGGMVKFLITDAIKIAIAMVALPGAAWLVGRR